MPRGESGSSPKKRAAATDLHERLSKDELIKRLKVSENNVLKGRKVWKVHLYRHVVESVSKRMGFHNLVSQATVYLVIEASMYSISTSELFVKINRNIEIEKMRMENLYNRTPVVFIYVGFRVRGLLLAIYLFIFIILSLYLFTLHKLL